MELPLVVSFYTQDTPYEEEVQHLINSCKRFGVEHLVEGIASSGSWEMNCAFKPLFLLQKMEEQRRPLLWVDADATFEKPLEWLGSFQGDVAVRMHDCPEDHRSRIASGTVYMNATLLARDLVRLWAEECLLLLQDPARTVEVWDQDALRRVLFGQKWKGDCQTLPISYCKIQGHPGDEEVCTDPTILHHQASRRYKRWINRPEERFF